MSTHQINVKWWFIIFVEYIYGDTYKIDVVKTNGIGNAIHKFKSLLDLMLKTSGIKQIRDQITYLSPQYSSIPNGNISSDNLPENISNLCKYSIHFEELLCDELKLANHHITEFIIQIISNFERLLSNIDLDITDFYYEKNEITKQHNTIEPSKLAHLYDNLVRLDNCIMLFLNPMLIRARQGGKRRAFNKERLLEQRSSNIKDYISNLTINEFHYLIKNKSIAFNQLIEIDYIYCKNMKISAYSSSFNELCVKYTGKRKELNLSDSHAGRKLAPAIAQGISLYIGLNKINTKLLSFKWIEELFIKHLQ